MQGKLRLKAHKLWSHLAVSFRKLPQTPPPRRPPQGARSAAENMHRLRPSYTRPHAQRSTAVFQVSVTD